ncbi:rhodanese-like domain-containing protein [Paracoccus salsus]|uniref:rhodanese-like domain-containing protein n=1 Tax=Paracoccus salsus TaxID=2911061 RepID=UPI001F3314ED|nr:rhodanese-like domain-containing protein [Paracoccus salsus]MCF3974028.1 rhodanese-like domain-containing protein [Paracoccus salsus]
MFRSAAILAGFLAVPHLALAQDAPRVGITAEIPSVTVETRDGPVQIMRDQTEGATLDDDWALTGRDCPPFCIQPNTPVEGVTTIGELEVLEALGNGSATVVDSRTPDWFATGTIPGAINIPYTQAVEQLAQLGCEPDFDGKFDCSAAEPVILFCNGLWCGQSPTAIRAMIAAGFPADRISYYRGGMQVWRLLGLTVAGGGNPVVEATTEEAAASDTAPVEAD